MIKQKITNQPVNFKMDKIPHKHRKGFREDAQLLGEAYDNVVNEALPGLIAGAALGGKAAAKTGLFKKSTGVMTGAAIGDSITGKGGSAPETTTTYTSDEEGELSDDWMKQDYESRQEGSAVEDAMDALQQIGIEIQEDIPGEDGSLEQQRNLAPLAKAHNLLSVALIKLVGEHGRNWVMGGQADAVDAAGSEPEQFTPMEFPSDEEY